MAKYFINDVTLKDMADNIRILQGNADTMSSTDMVSNLEAMVAEVNNQISVLNQIKTNLMNKVIGSGQVENLDEVVTVQDKLIDDIMTTLETKAIPNGISLPELGNPANPEHIVLGYQSIDGVGSIINGTHECPTMPELSNPASGDHILEGYQSIDENRNVITGTHKCKTLEEYTSDADATAETIFSPYSAYVNGKKVTGTATAETWTFTLENGDTVTKQVVTNNL